MQAIDILQKFPHQAGAKGWFYDSYTGVIHYPSVSSEIEDKYRAAHEAGHADTPFLFFWLHRLIPIKLVQLILEIMAILCGVRYVNFWEIKSYLKFSWVQFKKYL